MGRDEGGVSARPEKAYTLSSHRPLLAAAATTLSLHILTTQPLSGPRGCSDQPRPFGRV